MLTNAPKGTKDVLPSQVYKWHYVEQAFADICAKYGFKEIRTPVFEHTELFSRGVGDTTDIVQKEMYTFQDYGKRSITLKPEGTSPVVRAFIEHKSYADVQPSKYYYNTPCFRYEKPQSGRLRAFHQFGIEVFGTNNMLADAEVICLAHDFLAGLGIENVQLRINSVGCPGCREAHRKALRDFLRPKYDELCDTCKDRFERNPLRILDCKSEVCQKLVQGAPMMIDFLCEECKDAFDQVQQNLTSMGIEFVVDPGIVRGLDYYTKTAFEFVTDSIGAQGTVCGGGRYDHLIEEVGGPPIPGVGFGLGIERLLLTMEANGVEIPQPEGVDVFIAVMGDAAKAFGLKLLRQLRQAGVRAEMDTMARNIKGQFKYANRLHAKKTVVIGDNELAEKKVAIKDMETSQQAEVAMDDIIKELTK
ncbi:histidine--tRNA ligase [Ihubacter massiliensis]|uniref:Histidine--tRNA ligase n=1 Tax=Hominibacterium faecale TaxID=2839743 RepID=A0A9J6QL49_9FIRM|nr:MULTISPECIES: histidine--tRNA ligase [Eubacteriales Family XIII. Incertae Sedis]MCC2865319.1 histidine--tRNA ligase [Anaerovorax odorimutans]MCI7303845.1 histidine--tRNA ligase [Clostridia bacterium]MDY3011678.1 histidine--tRNA ligase [Clostridiales Family XIII bacterium]MCO7120957.1 histidine--tRNA ligase [Ihubacter massiliensis]MCU7377873.1 histidine--tRNA ligase [Hominibacterium faecale]